MSTNSFNFPIGVPLSPQILLRNIPPLPVGPKLQLVFILWHFSWDLWTGFDLNTKTNSNSINFSDVLGFKLPLHGSMHWSILERRRTCSNKRVRGLALPSAPFDKSESERPSLPVSQNPNLTLPKPKHIWEVDIAAKLCFPRMHHQIRFTEIAQICVTSFVNNFKGTISFEDVP